MGYPDLTFRSELDPTTRKELELYSSQLQGFLSSAGFGSDGKFNVNLQSAAVFNPIGSIKGLAHDELPDGWLWCRGAQVSRTTYKDLWQKLGTKYGAGNGTSTFNLPDYTGCVLVGVDSTEADVDAITDSGGTWDHVHATAAGDAHAHALSGDTGAGTAHKHSVTTTDGSDLDPSAATTYVASLVETDEESAHTHGFGSIAAANESTHTHGDTAAGNQKFHAVNWIIKT